MTDPGLRSVLCRIERATRTEDDYGGETLVWSELVSAYAQVFHGSGAERREAAQEIAQQVATFEFDWNPILATVLPSDRLWSYGIPWDIQGAPIIGANKAVHITAIATPGTPGSP